jgi:hypothetical protein
VTLGLDHDGDQDRRRPQSPGSACRDAAPKPLPHYFHEIVHASVQDSIDPGL